MRTHDGPSFRPSLSAPPTQDEIVSEKRNNRAAAAVIIVASLAVILAGWNFGPGDSASHTVSLLMRCALSVTIAMLAVTFVADLSHRFSRLNPRDLIKINEMASAHDECAWYCEQVAVMHRAFVAEDLRTMLRFHEALRECEDDQLRKHGLRK
jgi:hypothetical protein